MDVKLLKLSVYLSTSKVRNDDGIGRSRKIQTPTSFFTVQKAPSPHTLIPALSSSTAYPRPLIPGRLSPAAYPRPLVSGRLSPAAYSRPLFPALLFLPSYTGSPILPTFSLRNPRMTWKNLCRVPFLRLSCCGTSKRKGKNFYVFEEKLIIRRKTLFTLNNLFS